MLNKKHPQPNTLFQWRTGRDHCLYFSTVLIPALCAALAYPTLITDTGPLTIVNNLSDSIFSCIKAVSVIVLGWGIVQLGMLIQFYGTSQCIQGTLCVFSGSLIVLSKEILLAIDVARPTMRKYNRIFFCTRTSSRVQKMTIQTSNKQTHVRPYFGCFRHEATHEVRVTDFDKETRLTFNQPPPPKKEQGRDYER